jgi:hypothetical protein
MSLQESYCRVSGCPLRVFNEILDLSLGSTPMKMGRKPRIFSTGGVASLHVGFIHEILFRF